MTYVDGSFESNKSHTHRLREEEEREKAVLANDGVEKALVDSHKCLENIDNVLSVGVVKDGWRVVHIIEDLVYCV